jgi:hypothetical protein
MDPLYIKKINTVSGNDVWIVDGCRVREQHDMDFTNYGQHYGYPSFIPEHEFWIDEEAAPGEEQFYIASMQKEHEMMKSGTPYDEARVAGCAAEQALREQSSAVIQAKLMEKEALLAKIRKDQLRHYKNGPTAWRIDGELVRGLFFIDFTIGGHDKVYDFVPKNEIWIDDDVLEKELGFVLLHELHERNLMAKGMEYAGAHTSANEVEFLCRRNPALLEQKMAIEEQQL